MENNCDRNGKHRTPTRGRVVDIRVAQANRVAKRHLKGLQEILKEVRKLGLDT